jgi:hypothetical protein
MVAEPDPPETSAQLGGSRPSVIHADMKKIPSEADLVSA